MTTPETTAIAANVLAMCRKLDPWYPKPNPETVTAWAHGIAKKTYPPAVYYEAVQHFYLHKPDQHLTIGHLMQHARDILNRWETDPERRPQLTQWRQARRDEIDRQIVAGTFRQPKQLTQTTSPHTFMQQLEARRTATTNNGPNTRPAAPQTGQNTQTAQPPQKAPQTP